MLAVRAEMFLDVPRRPSIHLPYIGGNARGRETRSQRERARLITYTVLCISAGRDTYGGRDWVVNHSRERR